MTLLRWLVVSACVALVAGASGPDSLAGMYLSLLMPDRSLGCPSLAAAVGRSFDTVQPCEARLVHKFFRGAALFVHPDKVAGGPWSNQGREVAAGLFLHLSLQRDVGLCWLKPETCPSSVSLILSKAAELRESLLTVDAARGWAHLFLNVHDRDACAAHRFAVRHRLAVMAETQGPVTPSAVRRAHPVVIEIVQVLKRLCSGADLSVAVRDGAGPQIYDQSTARLASMAVAKFKTGLEVTEFAISEGLPKFAFPAPEPVSQPELVEGDDFDLPELVNAGSAAAESTIEGVKVISAYYVASRSPSAGSVVETGYSEYYTSGVASATTTETMTTTTAPFVKETTTGAPASSESQPAYSYYSDQSVPPHPQPDESSVEQETDLPSFSPSPAPVPVRDDGSTPVSKYSVLVDWFLISLLGAGIVAQCSYYEMAFDLRGGGVRSIGVEPSPLRRSSCDPCLRVMMSAGKPGLKCLCFQFDEFILRSHRRAPNVHQQMCTTRKPFQRLGGLLSNHPNQNQRTTNYQMRKCTAEKFLQLFRAL